MKELRYGEYKFKSSQDDMTSKIKRADFCLYDGEGISSEAYFFKIVKRNHKPKALKIIQCLTKLDERAFGKGLEKRIQEQIKYCDSCTEYPMTFMREKALESKLDDLRYKKNMPFVYKGCGNQLYYGDTSSPMRFTYKDDLYDNETTLVTLAWATALELMVRNGEIEETDYPEFLEVKTSNTESWDEWD